MENIIVKLTATSLWKLDQAQRGIVSWHWFESNIGVPLGTILLLGAQLIHCLSLIEFAMLYRADRRYFFVISTQLSRVIENWVNMKAGGLRTPCQFSESQYKFLLEVVGKCILSTEEDDPTLRD